MTVKKSKPLAVDRRDLHSLLDLIGGYGAVIAGIIAILSVCAAFLIYRSFRGQRGKTDEKNGNRTTAVTEEESSTRRRRRERDETESTGEYLEGKQKKSSRESESSDGTVLSAMDDNTLVSSESPEKDLNETTLKDLEDITDEVLTDLEPESGEKSDSDLDQCVEMDPDEPDSNIECEDHIQREDKDGGCKEDICEVLADVSMHTTRLDGQQARDNVEAETEEYLSECEKSETGQSVDADEPSETESAQENIYQKCLDVPAHKTQEDSLNHTVSKQDNSTSDQDLDPDSQSQFEAENKLLTLENLETNKKFEYHHDCFFQQTNDFDICCDDKQTDLPRVDIKTEKDNPIMMGQSCFQGLSYPKDSMSPAVEMVVNHQQHNNRFKYHAEPLNQNYLGFHTEKAFISGSSSQMSLSHGSVDRKADEGASALEKRNKMNEISIMDAIMDNNEWLNVGGPELRDLPWLKPAPNSNNSASEEKLTQKDKEGLETTFPLGQVEASLATQEEELANKKVATVPPMPLPVNVTFRIHYITYCPSQLVAVTGSLQELGAWESFVPLHRAKDGFWANTIPLPVESQVEWKFILVEDGKISRWEECGNRYLVLTSQDEEVYLEKCWGCI